MFRERLRRRPKRDPVSDGDEAFGTCDDSFAEYAFTPQDMVARKPADLTFEQAAVPTQTSLSRRCATQAASSQASGSWLSRRQEA
jgi:NADPH:quinone reductase-like Zn-dependent oxidoreductase